MQFLIKPGKESQFVNFLIQNLKYPKEFGLNIVVSVFHKINSSKLDFLMDSAETLIETQDLTRYIKTGKCLSRKIVRSYFVKHMWKTS